MNTLTVILTASLESNDKYGPSDTYLDVCHPRGADQALSSYFTAFSCIFASAFLIVLQSDAIAQFGSTFVLK